MRWVAHLTELAGLEESEFDFSGPPAVGGPSRRCLLLPRLPLRRSIRNFRHLMRSSQDGRLQFDVLAGLLSDEQLRVEATPAGRPIRSGWQSSPYGHRIDPISGARAWHDGVDFAGREGSDILAVASGVVSWSGQKSGYGTMVEVSHGDGLGHPLRP